MQSGQFVVFVHLRADTSWLRLSRSERNDIATGALAPIFAKHPDIKHQHFDAEAFDGRVSDVEMIAAPDARYFYDFFEDFRDSRLIAHGYFAIVDIFATFADGYKEFERSLAEG